MSLQNRVSPSGDIVANSCRGTVMGNRGKLAVGGDPVDLLARDRKHLAVRHVPYRAVSRQVLPLCSGCRLRGARVDGGWVGGAGFAGDGGGDVGGGGVGDLG